MSLGQRKFYDCCGPQSSANSADVAYLPLSPSQNGSKRIRVISRVHLNAGFENGGENILHTERPVRSLEREFGSIRDGEPIPRRRLRTRVFGFVFKPLQRANGSVDLVSMAAEIGQDHPICPPVIVHLQSLKTNGIETATHPRNGNAPRPGMVREQWAPSGLTSPGSAPTESGQFACVKARRVAQAFFQTNTLSRRTCSARPANPALFNEERAA